MITEKYLKGYMRLSTVLCIVAALVSTFFTKDLGWGFLIFLCSAMLSLLTYCAIVIACALGMWIWEGFKNGEDKTRCNE